MAIAIGIAMAVKALLRVIIRLRYDRTVSLPQRSRVRRTRAVAGAQLAPAHRATTNKRLRDAQNGLPNLQRITAPIAISNQLSRFESLLRFFVLK